MKRAILFLLFVCLAGVGVAGQIRSVPQSSPLRKQLLDMIRPKIEREVGVPVKFKIDKFVTQDRYAFVRFLPIRPDGSDINWKRTQFGAAYIAGGFDPQGGALFSHSSGRWRLLTYSFGATDVYWEDWPSKYGCSRALLSPPR